MSEKQFEKTTFLEKACGNLGTGIAATLIAASGGTYLAPLLPGLASSLANHRYQKRVDLALSDLNYRLLKYEQNVIDLTDNQFKLVGEIVSSILRTTSNSKMELLKNAVINGVKTKDIQEHKASILSRTLRDISVVEYDFVYSLRNYKEVTVMSPPEPDFTPRDGQIIFNPSTNEAQLLNSLVRLDLLILYASGFGGTLNYEISQIAYKLIDLCGSNINKKTV